MPLALVLAVSGFTGVHAERLQAEEYMARRTERQVEECMTQGDYGQIEEYMTQSDDRQSTNPLVPAVAGTVYSTNTLTAYSTGGHMH